MYICTKSENCYKLDSDKTRSHHEIRDRVTVLALSSSLTTSPVTHALENFYLTRAEDFAN
ncbi:hypothetical protein NDI44_20170 [Trichocoleus sp. DQ-A3]|uniref:hypothetical protein n=1 Tax=Cyanophyceae TaxID=3028117 RepID=UPI0016845C9A|nr:MULTISPECIES: hypothetical protein [unclassified Coleofasciculus]MBD1892280.1 hypothetical protein [Coleofasciculus sp. FACHB-SPT9]MBD1899758.1 hypothetical protein [Coleofasciculus sp. FACHB-125]